jgi:peptide-methionine (S)-S-oxide reductase
MHRLLITTAALTLTACVGGDPTQDLSAEVEGVPPGAEVMMVAGGCFWCVESDFEKLGGVYEVVSGYAGGSTPNPTYKTHVAAGHREVARIYYDPAEHDYAGLVTKFLRTVDVTDDGGQFCDRGHSYTTAVFFDTAEEQRAATLAIEAAEAEIGRPIVTAVLPEADFTAAEAYHQDYYEKNPVRYSYYRKSCGRDARVAALWGEPAS